MMMAFDFSGLTDQQKSLLTFQGWAPGPRRQPRPQTVRKLVQRGLVVEREIVFCGARIKAYDVPLDVHAAWCEHCAARARGAAA